MTDLSLEETCGANARQAPSCVPLTHAIGARLQNGRLECANDLYRQRQLHQMQIHGLR
jgi:hypothetical protein